MAVLDIIDTNAEKISEIELNDSVFNVTVKSHILHDVATMQLAKRRSGTAAVKHRSQVRGSSKKLFRQKGTGRARRGDIKSPLLRGGGSVFGPDPRNFEKSLTKKVRKQALKMALSSKLASGDLLVVDTFDMQSISTKRFNGILNTIDAPNALIIVAENDPAVQLSARNLPHTSVLRQDGLNVYDILKHRRLVITRNSIDKIEGRLAS